jgi:hypothetical protein
MQIFITVSLISVMLITDQNFLSKNQQSHKKRLLFYFIYFFLLKKGQFMQIVQKQNL